MPTGVYDRTKRAASKTKRPRKPRAKPAEQSALRVFVVAVIGPADADFDPPTLAIKGVYPDGAAAGAAYDALDAETQARAVLTPAVYYGPFIPDDDDPAPADDDAGAAKPKRTYRKRRVEAAQEPVSE